MGVGSVLLAKPLGRHFLRPMPSICPGVPASVLWPLQQGPQLSMTFCISKHIGFTTFNFYNQARWILAPFKASWHGKDRDMSVHHVCIVTQARLNEHWATVSCRCDRCSKGEDRLRSSNWDRMDSEAWKREARDGKMSERFFIWVLRT